MARCVIITVTTIAIALMILAFFKLSAKHSMYREHVNPTGVSTLRYTEIPTPHSPLFACETPMYTTASCFGRPMRAEARNVHTVIPSVEKIAVSTVQRPSIPCQRTPTRTQQPEGERGRRRKRKWTHNALGWR